MKLVKEIAGMVPELTNWRRQIHQHPELAFEEEVTSDLVASILADNDIELHRGIGGTGLVGIIRSGKEGPTIALRADMDALPMDDMSGTEHKSCHAGKSHACGHDGHTTMLLGASLYLAKNKPATGNVVLIFQPAEEVGLGAPKMIEDGLFDRFPCDEIYGCHNMPLIEKGKVGMRVGPTLSSYADLKIDVNGVGGHAAAPHTVTDPLQVAARLVTEISSLVGRHINPAEAATVGIGMLNAGSASNIIPDSAHIEGTIRSLSKAAQQTLIEKLTALCTGMETASGCKIDLQIGSAGLPCVNGAAQIDVAAAAATQVLGEENVDAEIAPYPFADDFAFFQDKIPGAYYFIGQGGVMVHEPTYDFDDDLLPIGASIFAHIIDSKLGLEKPIEVAA